MKRNSVRSWSRYYGVDHRTARRMRRRAARLDPCLEIWYGAYLVWIDEAATFPAD